MMLFGVRKITQQMRQKLLEGKKGARPGGMRRPEGRTPGGVQDQIRAKIVARALGKRQELGKNRKNWKLIQHAAARRGGGSLRAFRRAV